MRSNKWAVLCYWPSGMVESDYGNDGRRRALKLIATMSARLGRYGALDDVLIACPGWELER